MLYYRKITIILCKLVVNEGDLILMWNSIVIKSEADKSPGRA